MAYMIKKKCRNYENPKEIKKKKLAQNKTKDLEHGLFCKFL